MNKMNFENAENIVLERKNIGKGSSEINHLKGVVIEIHSEKNNSMLGVHSPIFKLVQIYRLRLRGQSLLFYLAGTC